MRDWLRSNRVWSEPNQPHTASTLWYGALSGFSNSPCQQYRPAIAPGTRDQWSPLSNESAQLWVTSASLSILSNRCRPPTRSATSGSLRTAIAVQPTLLVPIRLGAVIRVDFGTPGVVSHVRPVILVETGSGLEQFLIDVQNEPMLNRVHRKRTPWNRKQFIAHAQETPERKNRVRDAA